MGSADTSDFMLLQGMCTIAHNDYIKAMKSPIKMPVPFLMPLADSVGLPEAHVAFLESFQELENAPQGRLHLTRAWQQVTGKSTATCETLAQAGLLLNWLFNASLLFVIS